jgi:hypothetical protein
VGRSLRCVAGGIRSLAEVLRDHGEALRYDLLALGLRLEWLATPDLTWLDLAAVVQQRPPGSALARAIDGEDALWGLSEQLLAVVADRLGLALWQNGGGKGRKPDPIPRPGTRPRQVGVTARKLEAMTVDEFDRRYAARRARQSEN